VTAPILAFFNNKGGVGKTSLVYHLAWMLSELDTRVIAADLDPQANLTAAFVSEDRIEELWSNDTTATTIFDAVEPLLARTGDVLEPTLEPITDALSLLAGDLALSGFEDLLSQEWPKATDGNEGAMRVLSSFYRVLQRAAADHEADTVLVDLGPNLGAINRAALISSDYVLVPLSPDLFSLQGLSNLGPTLRDWRAAWSRRKEQAGMLSVSLPTGAIEPIGYVVLQHATRLDRPVKAYQRWAARIPNQYRTAVLDEEATGRTSALNDPHCLALLKHYRSLIPMAQEARKPIFKLRPADGAIGSHAAAVRDVYRDFRVLAKRIAKKIGLAE